MWDLIESLVLGVPEKAVLVVTLAAAACLAGVTVVLVAWGLPPVADVRERVPWLNKTAPRLVVTIVGAIFLSAGAWGIYIHATIKILVVRTSLTEQEYEQFRKLEERFESKQRERKERVRIESANVDPRDLVNILQTQRVDLVIFDVSRRMDIVREGLIAPLDRPKHGGSSGTSDEDHDFGRYIPSSVHPALLDSLEVGGRRYFLPYRPNVRIAWWRPPHENAACDSAPKTWQEVDQYARAGNRVLLSAKGVERGDESPDAALLLLEIIQASQQEKVVAAAPNGRRREVESTITASRCVRNGARPQQLMVDGVAWPPMRFDARGRRAQSPQPGSPDDETRKLAEIVRQLQTYAGGSGDVPPTVSPQPASDSQAKSALATRNFEKASDAVTQAMAAAKPTPNYWTSEMNAAYREAVRILDEAKDLSSVPVELGKAIPLYWDAPLAKHVELRVGTSPEKWNSAWDPALIRLELYARETKTKTSYHTNLCAQVTFRTAPFGSTRIASVQLDAGHRWVDAMLLSGDDLNPSPRLITVEGVDVYDCGTLACEAPPLLKAAGPESLFRFPWFGWSLLISIGAIIVSFRKGRDDESRYPSVLIAQGVVVLVVLAVLLVARTEWFADLADLLLQMSALWWRMLAFVAVVLTVWWLGERCLPASNDSGASSGSAAPENPSRPPTQEK